MKIPPGRSSSRRYTISALLAALVLAFVGAAGAKGFAGAGELSAAYGTSLLRGTSASALSLASPPWSANVIANTDNSGFGQHEPSLAVSPTNPDVVVVANKDYRERNTKRVWIEVSRDGGKTWPTQLHMPDLPSTFNESDPVVVARDDGRIYVACLTVATNGIFITWTDDNGLTWQPSVAVVKDQETIQDKPWFAVDNNPSSPYYHRVYMAWAPGLVVSSYSTDGGLTWTPPAQIPVDDVEQGSEYPYPVVTPNGDVFVFYVANWEARFPDISSVKVVRSTDGGASWSKPVTVSSLYQPPTPIRTSDQWRFFSVMSAAASPDNNSLYVAWTDYRNYDKNGSEVVYSTSRDHGATWSPPARLSHDPPGTVRDHITPVLKVDNGGWIHALWLDRRLDPANRLFQAWYSFSTDSGATWSPDEQVSDVPGAGFNLDVGLPPNSTNAAGDYWGLDVAGNYIYAAWNDTRNANQDIYSARKERVPGLALPPTSTPTVTPQITLTPTPSPTPVHVLTPSQLPGTASRLFPETGQSVTGLFLDYWDGHGALPQQGYPISPLLAEVSDLDGKLYTVQYFERAVFEYHPENPAPYNVLLSQLGTFRYKAKYPDGAPGQSPNTTPGSVLFPETNHRLGGLFLQYWQTHGGLLQQGYPISDEFTEVSDLDSKPYLVQYFERAVFEYHPENQPPYNVLLSQLGTFRYNQKYLAP